MSPLPMTFNDLVGHFCSLRPFYLTYLGKYSVFYLRYVYTLHINRVNVWGVACKTVFPR